MDKKVTKQKDEYPVKLVRGDEASDRIYANHVEYVLQPFEATLSFGEIDILRNKPVKDAPDGETTAKIRTKARVVLPLPVFDALARILKDYLEKQSKEQGEK